VSRWLKRLGLILLGLVVALSAVELVLRMKFSPPEIAAYISAPMPEEGPRWVDHPFFPFIGRPNAEYEFSVRVNGADVAVKVKNNSYGFRSHEPSFEKSPADYFVVALGESTTWGAAAETNAATWPELLETRLQAKYPERRVRVFNFGTNNATLAYSIAALALIGSRVRPALIIVYHGFNEFGVAVDRGYRVDHSHFFRDLGLGFPWPTFQRHVPAALLSSYTVAYLTGKLDEKVGANSLATAVQWPIEFDESLDDEGIKRAMTREWEHLETVEWLARGSGANALFSTFQYFDGNDHGYQLVNESLRNFFSARGLKYVDQDALIPDFDSRIQYDPCHFTRAGDEMMAANFFDAIVKAGYLERPRTQ
jgi:hypothetical protein